MMKKTFDCLVSSPLYLEHSGLAISAAVAGAVPILDLEFIREEDWKRARNNFEHFITSVPKDSRYGLRLAPSQISDIQGWSFPSDRSGRWTVIYDWDLASLSEMLKSWGSKLGKVVVEITSRAQLTEIEVLLPRIDALIARGNETGGWAGSDAAYVLSQKLVGSVDLPVYVQGGIGVNSTAACRVLGAAGVVLDDVLWLFPESPLRRRMESVLSHVDLKDSVMVGDSTGSGCRVLSRPDLAGARRLLDAWREFELREAASDEGYALKWKQTASELIGFGDLDTLAFPMGPTAVRSKEYVSKYRTVGRFIQHLLKVSRENADTAVRRPPLSEASSLAEEHGTRFPIVQGPMTRVSDRAEFARAVADGGGLPMLALALMDPSKVKPLLDDTARQLGEAPWGVGLLGFAPKELLDAQMELVVATKPAFALVAGGRPTQAKALEKVGIRTYIHAPVPRLLENFIEQGARRFVLEGRECGGHVGPLSSFVLWEQSVDVVLRYASKKNAEPISVLFAGGIHDRKSAAMVAAMAAPLVERGVRVGVLMGTPYIFARETVESGAIVSEFQNEALKCERTYVIETSPGHQIRCSNTPFISEFEQKRRTLLQSGTSAAEIREGLEKLSLGRLRVASKGLERDPSGNLIEVDIAAQQRSGMYMLGDTATMHSAAYSIEELHREVSEGSSQWLDTLRTPVVETLEQPQSNPSRIAIVGMASFLPGAADVSRYWRNLLDLKNAMTEVPRAYWDWRLYYQDLKPGEARDQDKTVSKWGGFLDEIAFDPIRYGIPPKSLKRISPAQLMALEAVYRTVQDAGYTLEEIDRENTSVIFGNDGSSPLKGHYLFRTLLPLFWFRDENIENRLPEWGEEAFPGILANVTPGRVSNRFDFGGTNFVVDAACASSLKAVDLAVQELESGRSECVLVGGVDIDQSPEAYVAFSSSQALSPTGQVRTFDRSADGIVISEGIAVAMLKRLEDAERDGDRIYALIQGAGSSSDGKALGLTAPNTAGQQRAFKRAYQRSGIDPMTIGLYEAHGTGTVVGDRTELQSFQTLLRNHGAPSQSCAIGSHKTLIGHTKTAAGLAGLLKASLALHHKVIAPHAGVDSPIDGLNDEKSPVFMLNQAAPWFKGKTRRRSGVSAFGFGGTNTHVVLEEYEDPVRSPEFGARTWPAELFLFCANDEVSLKSEIDEFAGSLKTELQSCPAADIAYTLACKSEKRLNATVRLAVVASGPDELIKDLRWVVAQLEKSAAERQFPKRIAFHSSMEPVGKVAMVFPGQGAQYVNMARESSLYFRELRDAFEQADLALDGRYPQALSRYVFPSAVFSEEAADNQKTRLTDTHVAQAAIGTVSMGLFRLLNRIGVSADSVCGHSYGEFTALWAGGACSDQEFLEISESRGSCMADASRLGGKMLVVFASRESIREMVDASKGELCISNHNAPSQVVLSGSAEAIERAVAELDRKSVRYRRLNVAGPFHSKWMEPAKGPLEDAIGAVDWRVPEKTVYSNIDGLPYPSSGEKIREQLRGHLLHSVEFVAQVERMYQDGVEVFVECGPNHLFSKLIGQILEGKPHTAVSLDHSEGSMDLLLSAVGRLQVVGVVSRPSALFTDREVQLLDFSEIREKHSKYQKSSSLWYIDGSGIRSAEEKLKHPGKMPPLEMEESEKLIETHHRAYAALRAPEPSNGTSNGKTTFSNQQNMKTEHPSGSFVGHSNMPAPSEALAAYESYQKTMRQFLKMEETLMLRFLGGASSPISGGELENGHTEAAFQPPPNLKRSGGALPEVPTEPLHGNGAEQNGHATVSEVKAAPKTAGENAPKAEEAEGAFSLPDRESLKSRLLKLVSERTGYPESMLEMDSDLESELGIDSIKRIEILAKVMDFFPAAFKEQLNEQFEHLTQMKTLDGILDEIFRSLSNLENSTAGLTGENADKESVSEVSSDETADEAFPDCPLCVMSGREEALISGTHDTLRSKLYLVTTGSDGLANLVAGELERAGARSIILSDSDCASRESIEQKLKKVRSSQEAIHGVVHLSGMADFEFPGHLTDWKEHTRRDAKVLFHLLQALKSDVSGVSAGGLQIISASRMDGMFGRSGNPVTGAPTGGSGAGLLKTLKTEWEDLKIRVIDFDHSLGGRQMAQSIVSELADTAPEVEVGYFEGRRRVFDVEQIAETRWANQDTSKGKSRKGWVVLATGGARGITAEILKRYVEPEMKIILVGRSPLIGNGDAQFDAIEDPGKLREALISDMRKGQSEVTPVQVEKRLKAILQSRERRDNIETLRSMGADVEYRSANVGDETEFIGLLTSLYEQYGRIDSVLHGAGILEDKLFVDKTPESFDRVFDVKVDSAFLLGRHLRQDSLREIVFFSSIAGRFGNRGQSDYAAANEVLNRFAWYLSEKWKNTRVISVNWGPWADVGMAVTPGIASQFKAQGIYPIQPEAGCKALLELLDLPDGTESGCVEVIAGRGKWMERPLLAK